MTIIITSARARTVRCFIGHLHFSAYERTKLKTEIRSS